MVIPNSIRPLNLLLYAAVPHRSMLEQGFYAAEIEGLRADSRVGNVASTNSLSEVRRAEVDGIVSYFYSHSAVVGAIAKARGIPAIATGGCEQLRRDHTTSAHVYAARVTAFHTCTLLLHRVLATSTADLERMRQVAIMGRDKIELSFHGVAAADHADPQHFTRSRNLGSLITIAGLDSELNVRRKGVLEAVDLLARFHIRDPSASLTVIGRDTCRAMVEAHANARGVAGKVRFTGYITEDQKLDLLRQARFYVQLSEYEGFGIGALEALAQGCQVIHSGMGGLRDTVAHYGILLNRNEIDQFDIHTLTDYSLPDWSSFKSHLAQFSVAHRSHTLIRALGLDERASEAMNRAVDQSRSQLFRRP